MRWRHLAALLASSTLACSGIDSVLEAPAPQDTRISIGLETGSLTVAQGADASVGATVTRLADYAGTVDLSVDGAPDGITVRVGAGATVGKATSASLTIHVAPDAKIGTYIITVRARGTANNVAGTVLGITVVEPPSYDLTLSRGSLTLIPGAAVPVGVRLSRRAFTAPVTVNVSSQPPGVTAQTATVSGDTATVVLSASHSAQPGAYTASVVGTSPGLGDRTVLLPVTISADAMIVSADRTVSVAQAQTAVTRVYVSTASGVGAVAARVEDLPPGASALVTPVAGDSHAFDVSFTVPGATAAGNYLVTVRASAAGVPDATTTLQLVVRAASIALSVSPPSVNVFAGTSVTVAASVARTDFTGPVTLTAENVPAGMTVSIAPLDAATNTAAVALAATSNAVPGQYSLIIRAAAAGLPASASRMATLDVTLRAAPASSGNVLLDFSRCGNPLWVAGQDGAAPWTQLQPADGIYRFNVESGKAGVAWIGSDSIVNVRYMTQGEATAGALDLCGEQGRKTVTGTGGVHATQFEQFYYNLGGGFGLSTQALPAFTISGVRDGTHDLVAWGQSNFAGARGLIRRDVNLPDGGSLGAVTLTGDEGFAGQLAPTTIAGPVIAGDLFSYTLRYLTGASCDNALLYTGGGGAYTQSGNVSYTSQFYTVPSDHQRGDDFHYFTVSLGTSSSVRTAGLVAHQFGGHTVTLAPAVGAPVVTPLSGSVKRLQVAYGDLPARYNESVSLEYSDGRTRFMKVSASVGYTGTTGVSLAMPDLAVVSGFPISAAISPTTTGSWTATLTGASVPGSLCAEGKTTASLRHIGTF